MWHLSWSRRSLPRHAHDGEVGDRKTPEPESAQLRATTPDVPDGYQAVTPERGYYKHGGFFIKRSLRPSEFMTGTRGLWVPRLGIERLQNEAESMRFIRRVSDIPVPQLYGAFEVDGSYILILEYIEGVPMAQLSKSQRREIYPEIDRHWETLRKIKSKTIGGPSGLVIPPSRVLESTDHDDTWPSRSSESDEYVFCHNDLSQGNIIVDPKTLKIKAILDWEYAGFYPPYFDAPWYKRRGPSSAMDGEADDVPKLLQFLNTGSSE